MHVCSWLGRFFHSRFKSLQCQSNRITAKYPLGMKAFRRKSFKNNVRYPQNVKGRGLLGVQRRWTIGSFMIPGNGNPRDMKPLNDMVQGVWSVVLLQRMEPEFVLTISSHVHDILNYSWI